MISNRNKVVEKCKASKVAISGKTFDMRGNTIRSTKMGTTASICSEGNPLLMAMRSMKNRHKRKKK